MEWKEPPPDGRGHGGTRRHRWRPIAEELRAHPGEWACLARAMPSGAALAARINGGHACWGPPDTFEAVTRSVIQEDGRRTYDLYARYVGANKEGVIR
jgi:hypothetical protein